MKLSGDGFYRESRCPLWWRRGNGEPEGRALCHFPMGVGGRKTHCLTPSNDAQVTAPLPEILHVPLPPCLNTRSPPHATTTTPQNLKQRMPNESPLLLLTVSKSSSLLQRFFIFGFTWCHCQMRFCCLNYYRQPNSCHWKPWMNGSRQSRMHKVFT